MQFQDVIGQNELKQQLIAGVQNDRLAHALLFLGKAGYGGLPLALAFVQYVFCANKQEQDSCGQCAACRKISQLQHPDLHFSFPTVLADNKTSDALSGEWREQIQQRVYFSELQWLKRIDPKGRQLVIGVDEGQNLINKLQLKSYEGGKKVMIIWGADFMNSATANKLLKILEEPPKDTLFILLAAQQEKLLQTIISRVQIKTIPRIDTDSLSLYLRSKMNLGPEQADSIAGRAEGNLVEALEQTGNAEDQDLYRERFIQLMRVCFKKNVLEMMNWGEDVSAMSKEEQRQFLKYGLHMIRQSMLFNFTEEQLLNVSDAELNFLKNFAKYITGNNVQDFIKMFNDAEYYIERNANAKLLFTQLCFQVMRYIHAA